MEENKRALEERKKRLLTDIYAGVVAGMPEMLLEEEEIRTASEEEIDALEKRHGY